MVTLNTTMVTRDVIQASDITNHNKFILGTAGYGQLFRPNDISDATNYSTIVGNQDSTNGRALRITYGTTASATMIAQFNKLGLTMTQLASSSDPGAGTTLIYPGNDGRLYIFPTGGAATRMATFAEVSGSGFVPGTPQVAQLGSPYSLTTSTADIGVSVSLGVGKWAVHATFYFIESGAADVGSVFIGFLATSGGTVTVSNSGAAAVFTPQTANLAATVSQTWYVNVTSTTTVKLQATKTSGTGASTVGITHTTLSAFLASN